MYVRTSKALGTDLRSDLYGSSINGFGDSSRKPVLLTHYHVRKVLHAGSGLLSDPSASVMTAAQMKPGFVNDGRRVRLQTEVTALVQNNYRAAVSPKVNLRIALVDLTEAKYHTPIFAGYWAYNQSNPRDGATVEGGSLSKILALYAIYQLRFDLNTFATLNGITKGSALQGSIAKEWKKAGLRSQPKLTGLFQFVENAGRPVEARLRGTPAIHENRDARALIVNLGFEYIGSVALQSGLFDEKHGGLWLNAAYGKPALTWTSSPFPTLSRHSVTAYAAASFFTLLAQGRLVNQASSNEIANVLKSVQCMQNGLLDGVKPLPGGPTQSPNKCGILPPLYHDAIHMIRQPVGGKRLEYVAVVLSEEPPELDFTKLGKELDSIIARENP
jgi:hypothetical protein